LINLEQSVERCEGSVICTLMDLFDSRQDRSKSLNALSRAPIENIALNYMTWREYALSIHEKKQRDIL